MVDVVDGAAGGQPGRLTSPMVGRERERRRLRDAFEQAVSDRSCQLFTVLGLAGVGKSRLVQEFLDELDGPCTRCARPLPALRRGHHVLAARRSGQGGRRARRQRVARGGAGEADAGSRGGSEAPSSPPSGWPTRSGWSRPPAASTERFAAVRELFATLARDAPAGRRLRRHPLGRGHVPRPRRVPRRLGARRSDPARLPRAAGAARAAAGLGRRQAERDHDAARAALRRRMRGPDREPRRAAPGWRRRSRRGSPTLPKAIRCSSRRCCRC